MATSIPLKISFARILVPTDFTDISDQALEFAKAIARRDQSEIVLAHVFAPISPVVPGEADWFNDDAALERVNQQLEDKGFELRSEGFQSRAISLTGSIQQEILTTADRENVDLIVLGTHLKGGWERFFTGSDAEAIYRQAKPPVLVIGPEAQPIGIRAWKPRSVVCASDLTPASAPIAAYAATLAEEFHASFALFHVTDPISGPEDEQVKVFLEGVRSLLFGTQISPDDLRTPTTWTPHDVAIVDLARKRDADLIVMGAHSASSLKTHFVHGIASKVIHAAPCPVLIVHP